MLYLKVDVTGGDRFRRTTDPKGAITRASWAFMRAQGAVYLKHAITEAPVGRDWSQAGGFNRPGHPGLLQKSHVLRVIDPFHAEVVNTQPYSTFVYTGTKPHMPPASSGLPWVVRHGISMHGTKANPWFDRAFAAGEGEIQGNLDKMGEDILKEVG